MLWLGGEPEGKGKGNLECWSCDQSLKMWGKKKSFYRAPRSDNNTITSSLHLRLKFTFNYKYNDGSCAMPFRRILLLLSSTTAASTALYFEGHKTAPHRTLHCSTVRRSFSWLTGRIRLPYLRRHRTTVYTVTVYSPKAQALRRSTTSVHLRYQRLMIRRRLEGTTNWVTVKS